ncbi:MAG: MmcQ/YjbR family DNA-binding protein [Paludibacteraceae bacterium]|nr:MmcQ/YjbR family DNA-binding protein [Paludibacteraceae bacterium]
MNVEDYRDYCLSLGADVEEKLPFVKFKNGDSVLVFYVCGHMFCFFDLNDFQVVSLKCQPEQIDELKAQYDYIGNPYNESPKHWIGLDPHATPDDLAHDLIRNSYEIVKAKYSKKKLCNEKKR